MEYQDLKGKKAVVTGAGAGIYLFHHNQFIKQFVTCSLHVGIGKSVCIKLHQLGVEVYAISKTKANLESLEKECPGIKTIQQALADWKGTKEKIEALPLFELLVNNAGLGNQNLFIDVPEDEMDKLV